MGRASALSIDGTDLMMMQTNKKEVMIVALAKHQLWHASCSRRSLVDVSNIRPERQYPIFPHFPKKLDL